MTNSARAGGIAPDRAAVVGELARLAASNCFRKADRCLRLLRHLTNMTLEGRSGELKEYALGVTVLERPDGYDPRIDPVVRLEARRLRLKLAEYYQAEGLGDPVIIELPKGGYVPEFRLRSVPESVATPAVAQRRGTFPIWLPIAVVLLALAFGAWLRLRKKPSVLPVRASIAVMGFRDRAPRQETSWISAALSEVLNLDLGAEQQLRTLPLENVARVRTELSLTPEAVYPVQLLQRIRADLGSDYVVTGSYLQSAQRVRVDVMLFDARSGQQVAAISDESPQEALPELAQRCAGRIRAQLGVRLPASGLPSFQAAAMEQYARGMERLRQGDALGARVYLAKAVEAAPSNPLFHSGLAAALSLLGMDTQAGQEAKLALDSSGDLGRVEQLEIEGRYRAIAHDWSRGIQVYQALFTLLPDDLEYGLLLASAQYHGGQGQEALRTVSTLRSLPSPLGDDPRVDLAEAQAAGALSDFAHTQKAAHSAAGKARARGARLQYAKARLLESGAMQNLNMAGFEQVRAEARSICEELGDHYCVAAAYRIEANQMALMGQLAAARQLYGSALEIANQMGNSNEKLNALSGLANAAKLQGDLPASQGYSRTALPIASGIGPQKSYAVYLDLAGVLTESGRIPEARSLIEQALQIARQVGDREGTGLGEVALAHTLAYQCKIDAALSEYQQALKILREVNNPYEVSETLLEFGDTQLDQGDLAEARKSFKESRTLAPGPSSGTGQPEIELGFAQLSFAEGRFGDAAVQARSALTGFTTSGRQADRYQAAAVLSRALLGQNLVGDAAAVLDRLPAPDTKKFPVRSVVPFEIARCFVLARMGRRSEALGIVDSVITSAGRGIPKFERDAILAKQAIQSFPL